LECADPLFDLAVDPDMDPVPDPLFYVPDDPGEGAGGDPGPIPAGIPAGDREKGTGTADNSVLFDLKKYDYYPVWREKVADNLYATGLYKESSRYRQCGKMVRDYCPACGHKELKTRSFWCESRICPECAERAEKKIFIATIEAMKSVPVASGWRWRHITITQKRVDYVPLTDDLEKLKGGLNRLRKFFCNKKRFKITVNGKKVFGALGGIEFGPKNGMVHAHILAYTPFLDQDEIQSVIGLGWIGIKEVKTEKGIKEVTRYCVDFTGKGDGLPSPDFMCAVAHALKGKRRIFTWGSLYNKIRIRKEFDFEPKICPKCGGMMLWHFTEYETGPPEDRACPIDD